MRWPWSLQKPWSLLRILAIILGLDTIQRLTTRPSLYSELKSSKDEINRHGQHVTKINSNKPDGCYLSQLGDLSGNRWRNSYPVAIETTLNIFRLVPTVESQLTATKEKYFISNIKRFLHNILVDFWQILRTHRNLIDIEIELNKIE